MCARVCTCVGTHGPVCVPACTQACMCVCTVHTHAHTSLPSAPQGSPADVTAPPGSGSRQSSAGLGARGSRKPPNPSADRDTHHHKKAKLLKLPRAGGGAHLGKDHPLPRGGAFESTPWTAAHRRLRAASDPRGEAQNTSSLSQIQAGELSKRTLRSSYPRHKASPEDSEEGPGGRVATGAPSPPLAFPKPWARPRTQGRQKPRGSQFPPSRPPTWAWICLWGEPMPHAPAGDAVCPGPSVPGSEPTSRWQTQHSPSGCPPPGWVRGGHWEVPGEAWAELRGAEAEGCPVCPTPTAVGLGTTVSLLSHQAPRAGTACRGALGPAWKLRPRWGHPAHTAHPAGPSP